MSNHTLPPLPEYTLTPQSPVIPGFHDAYLTLALPIIAYWAVSLFFHFIDEWDLFPQYRLHTPAEVLKRNHASRWEVARDVVIQQIVQTAFGLVLTVFDPEPMVGKEEYDIAVWAQRVRIAQSVIPGVLAVAGLDAGQISKNMGSSHPMLASVIAGGEYNMVQKSMNGVIPAFASWELLAAKAIYYAGIPALQFFFAVLIVDTWQYFLHRAMHMNKWLYTTFHSRHHRLYVPYAYGALYNHPFEGFLLDTLGTGLAYLLTGMTVRQSMWFFTCSTIKTVDDHCGYALPFDPLQHITSNNAGYHDVHHQSWGIKTNFSQPFFTFWDRALGTMWTGGDVSARYERARLAAQKKVDTEQAAALSTTTAAGKTRTRRSNSETIYSPVYEAGESVPKLEPAEEEPSPEEKEAQKILRRSPRKKNPSSAAGFASPMKELRSRVNTSLHGKGSGVLGVESSS